MGAYAASWTERHPRSMRTNTPNDGRLRQVLDVPVPPSTAELVRAIPIRIDTPLIFPTPSGKLWWERNFYRDVWHLAQEA